MEDQSSIWRKGNAMDENIKIIYNMLKWKNTPETIEEGKRLAREVKDLSLLIMPASEPSVWEYCADILSEKDEAELSPYLDSLFNWISDLNLPGAMTILERLVKFDGEKLKDAFVASYNKAAEIDGYEGLCRLDYLSDFLDNADLRNILPDDIACVLRQHYHNWCYWDKE